MKKRMVKLLVKSIRKGKPSKPTAIELPWDEYEQLQAENERNIMKEKVIIDGINQKYKRVLLACCGLFDLDVIDDLFQAIEQLQAENERLKTFLSRIAITRPSDNVYDECQLPHKIAEQALEEE